MQDWGDDTMIYIAKEGDTWDSIAYRAYKDEFLFPAILEANRQFSDVVLFTGGEQIQVPDRVVSTEKIVATPFDTSTSIAIISTPWD
jgi:nucleoid-associated protein YgaU